VRQGGGEPLCEPQAVGPNEDFLTYPRPLERDLELLHAAQVDAVFLPGVEEMYSTRFATVVDLQGLEDISGEAKSRPGFFRGVATVCTKLFNIVQPDAVFFGQKDAMQCTVIRRIVQDLDMPIAVHVCPTHREHDGLAFSTRNAYLQEADRAAAPVLFRALSAAMAYYDANPAIKAEPGGCGAGYDPTGTLGRGCRVHFTVRSRDRGGIEESVCGGGTVGCRAIWPGG